MNATAGKSLVSISQVVNIGAELKRELEIAAREQNGDATWLARRVLREYVETRELEPPAR